MQKVVNYILLGSIMGIKSLAFAQDGHIDALQIGEKVPDIKMSRFSNYPIESAKISDFRGKLLILDFWGIHCSSCIKEMPEMQKFQQQFEGKIQILLVTRDSKKDVGALFKELKFLRNVHLPIVVEDTILSTLFPYTALGLQVWIDGKGILREKTNEDAYTSEDIQQFLNGKEIDLPLRNEVSDFDRSAPLWIEGNGRQMKHIKYHSYIADNISDFAGGGEGIQIDSASKKIIGIHAENTDILSLYNSAFSKWSKIKWYKTILTVKDSSKYYPPLDKSKYYAWSLKNTYCYELQVPIEKSDQLFVIMQQDLERYFDLQGSIEKTNIKCWVLVCKNKVNKLFTRGDKPVQSFDTENDSIIVGNITLKSFVHSLNGYSNVPILDETNYSNPVDLELHTSFDNYTTLRKELQKYGLDLVEEYRDLDCLVLREKGYSGVFKN